MFFNFPVDCFIFQGKADKPAVGWVDHVVRYQVDVALPIRSTLDGDFQIAFTKPMMGLIPRLRKAQSF